MIIPHYLPEKIKKIFVIDLIELEKQNVKCFTALNDSSWLWHRRLGHCNVDSIARLSRKELVKGLPKIKFKKGKLCDSCLHGKQSKISFPPKNFFSTSRPL